MIDRVKALNLYLATLTPSPSGWLTLDRDRAAAALGIGRVKLARILTKAEKALGIIVEGDRVRMKTQDELFREEQGLYPGWKDDMLAAVASVLDRRAVKSSQHHSD